MTARVRKNQNCQNSPNSSWSFFGTRTLHSMSSVRCMIMSIFEEWLLRHLMDCHRISAVSCATGWMTVGSGRSINDHLLQKDSEPNGTSST